MTGRLHVLVPFWGLAGGVIKVLDYADHGRRAGMAVTLWAPEEVPADDPLLSTLPVLDRLLSGGVEHRLLASLDSDHLDTSDVVLFTEPAHAALIDRLSIPPERVVHLVQGTRHATPTWNGGLHYRLLHRPYVRIAVSEKVRDAIAPHVHPALPLHLVPEGHDIDYFEVERPPIDPHQTIRVLYSTWKSDLGDRVAALCEDDGFAFTPMRTPKSWPQLANHYRSTDIFLGCPGPEEGFYLPGLEAMAAGCVVVMALVGGNEAYAQDGVNMIACAYDDAQGHAAALRALANDSQLRTSLALAGRATARSHHRDSERVLAQRVLREPLGNYDEAVAIGEPSTQGAT